MHTTSRLPLANSSMELATAWQNPAAAGAAAAPFYNLQRFPGYYQAAFPQLSSAYLHSLWPQNSWPPQPPTAAQQFQQHHLEQQRQAEAVAATAAVSLSAKNQSFNIIQWLKYFCSNGNFFIITVKFSHCNISMFFQQYGQLTNSTWMGANTQISADTSPFTGATGDNRLRNAVSDQISSPVVTSNINFQMAITAAAGTCSQRPATTITAITNQPSIVGQNISAQSNQLLQSLAQHTPASRSVRALACSTVSGNIIPSARATSTHHHYSANSRSFEMQGVSRLTDRCSTQVVATPSSIDSIKRMECDSSVPSPPKSQQQATAAVFGVVPPIVGGIHRTPTTVVSSQPVRTSVTAIHAATQVQAQVPSPLPSAATVESGSVRRFSNHGITTAVSTCNPFSVPSTVPSTLTEMSVSTVIPSPSTSGVSAEPCQMRILLTKTSVTTEERRMDELQRGMR